MKKKLHLTNVSPSIMRQIPEYSNLIKLKRLNASVSIDYLSINVTSIDDSFIRTFTSSKFKTKNNAFRRVEVLDYRGHEFSISSESYFEFGSGKFKDSGIEKDFKYQITINPSYFKDSVDVKNLLNLITKDIEEGTYQLSRLDISFALTEKIFSPLLASTMCHLKWKRANTDFRQDRKSGRLTGVHYKSKSISVSIYLHDLVKRNKTQTKHHVTEEGMTIFEMQLKKSFLEKANLIKLSDLENFEWSRVFKKYEFYDLVSIKPDKKNVNERMEIFQDDVRTKGFLHARIDYNRENHRNFQREIARYLSPLKINHGKASVIYCLQRRFEEYITEWNPWTAGGLILNNDRNFIPQSFGEIPIDQPCLN